MASRIESTPLLRLERVAKAFEGVQALRDIGLELRAGEVLGLIGENGAGKSTLIKILSGVHAADAGTIEWLGTPVFLRSPHDAFQQGIATIHQELTYFARLTVAENLSLAEPWPRLWWGGVNWPGVYAEAERRLRAFGLDLAPAQIFDQLSAAQKQEVAIARALSRQARLLILDEPTASLTEPEVQRLFARLRSLRDSGVAILYVSHRLDEIMSLTDRVAVLRDGTLVGRYVTRETRLDELVKAMVGRPLDQVFPRTRQRATGPALLELEGLSRDGLFEDVSFAVRAGEIVGLAGLVGAGRSELARALYGLYPVERGVMRLRGASYHPATPSEALARGLVYLPEERKRQSLVVDHSVASTISLGFSDLLTRAGRIPAREEAGRILEAMRRLDVRATGPDQTVGTLSGGNQQKAILARWLERQPEVLLLDEPTRGVDVGAKAEIHAWIDKLAAGGKAVLLISSDLPEIIGMSDRVLVMYQGRIAAQLEGPAMTQENILLAASGLVPHS